MLKRVMAVLLVVPCLAVLASCNTVEGAGRDVERGAEKVQEEAREHR